MGRERSTELCPHEAAVIAALEARALDTEASLLAHTRECEVCQEAIEVWHYLQTEAHEIARDLEDAPLRHPGLIWWRRRILDQQAAAHRLLQPIAVFQIAAGIAGLIALSVLLFTHWSAATAGGSSAAGAAIDVRIIGVTALLALGAFVPLAWAGISALRHRPGRQ